ncbi:MAG: ATP-grasp domain-containing protein [Roseburia sp. 1XD42-69]|jgi:Biotin carboxylase
MEKMLFLRGGIKKEFAFKTFFRMGHQMLMIDVPNSKEISLADYKYVISDIYSENEMFELALKIYKEIGFSGICTFMTSPLRVVGKLSDRLKLNYFSEESAKTLANKFEVRKKLFNSKLQKIQFSKITSFRELEKEILKYSYPVILKPTDNASSRGVIRIDGEGELKEAFSMAMSESHNGELLLEEFIFGDEYCAEIFVYKSIPYVISISKKIVTENKFCIELLDITPAPLNPGLKQKISEFLQEVILKFDINNWLLHVEFKVDARNNIYIIEINTRAAGGKLVESIYHLFGVNIYEMYFNMLLQKEIEINVLNELIERKCNQMAGYYTFINPKNEGYIKSIKGIERVRNKLGKREEFELFYKVGDFLPEATSNLEFKGSFYLFDDDYNNLLNRIKMVENIIEIEV